MSVFCGSNSSGKSTVIQAVLLIAQNSKSGRLTEKKIELMGRYYSFGTIEDVQCHQLTDAFVEVKVNDIIALIEVPEELKDLYVLDLVKDVPEDKCNIFDDFVYLSAGRIGPENSSDIRVGTKEFDVGINGEYAFSEYNRLKDKPMSNISLAEAITGLSEKEVKLNVALEKAMNTICPGFSIRTNSVKGIDKVTTAFSPSNHGYIRPTNAGFGFSSIFPIVFSALCMNEGGVLIIENPEIHLHPKAQSELAKFLALVSTHGVQVIVETHSDHIINGLRLYTKQNKDFIGKTIINSIKKIDGSAQPKLTEITLVEHGRLSDLDVGFFDQIQNDLLELF
jgi:predicted ATPase